MRQRVISARICRLRIKGRFSNYSIINVHCPHEGRPDDEKESFYAQLEQVYDSCPQRDVKIVIGDMNAQSEVISSPAKIFIKLLGDHLTNKQEIKSTTANIDSDHYLVAVCMRAKLSTVYNKRRSRTPRPNTEQLRDTAVAMEYSQQLEAALPTEEQILKMAEGIFEEIFAIRQVLQKGRELNVATHHLFFDFKSAYDTIDRDKLCQIMHEHGFPDKLTRMIKATMDRVMCVVRVSGILSSPFESRRGLRQGDGLSCLQFNIALQGVIRRAGIDTSGTIFRKSVQLYGFADDIDIVTRNFETMKETYIRLKTEASRIGIGDHQYIGGDEIEVVDVFVYLGSLVTADNDTSREIQRRNMAGNRAYFGLRKTLRSSKIRRITKLTVYKTLIRPVVLYGHETWVLLAEDQRALSIFERKVLRTIYGGVQMDDGMWRRRTNHELQQLLGESPIVHTAKIGRLRWVGHVVRMSDDSPVKMVLDNDPIGTRRKDCMAGDKQLWTEVNGYDFCVQHRPLGPFAD
ncbi:uncharacterized protein LOC129773689 [Toxorhynchites rutilus septentrionalis]|uniref:uncharacterized protein LOC129773689 n=1 Tax=Toxorhynchites rutilus septentrionalis TaxID=329112 RepID=UPI002478C120|nr:uncharacterized protein LOC129773689 [Toxorhynchites rutilus septentrionalis]